jgi:Na+/H+ antiporter NhaD/arsenite permease-like protein
MEWLAITVTLAVIAVAIIGIMIYRFPADITLLGCLTILLIYGTIDPENGLKLADGLQGFANPGVLTVAVLFVLADGLYRTGAFEWLGIQLLGVPKNRLSAQVRTMLPAAILSAFLNNTPVVALMMPIINDWCRKHRISVSHLFLPLSYAAILGGTCTLIGTSTTIVINHELPPELQLSMFELSVVGVPASILGLIFIAVATRWLLSLQAFDICQACI